MQIIKTFSIIFTLFITAVSFIVFVRCIREMKKSKGDGDLLDRLFYKLPYIVAIFFASIFLVLGIVGIFSYISNGIATVRDKITATPMPTEAVATIKPTISPTPIPTPEPTSLTKNDIESITEHRPNVYGISNKSIAISPTDVTDVPKDATGNWRVFLANTNIPTEQFALDYYRKAFKNDKEVHFIINMANNTTTSINKFGNVLMLSVYDHVFGEENDAKKMPSGTHLSDLWVYIDNGDIEKIN